MQNQNWRFLNRVIVVATVALLVVSFSTFVAAQDERTPEQPGAQQAAAPYQAPPAATFRPQGTVITPASSVARPEDAGVRAHTNHLIFAPAGPHPDASSPNFAFETPASVACVYAVGPLFAGCNPRSGSLTHAGGGWGAIALVDAYDNPNAASDLAVFSQTFGLPLPGAKFTKVYANSSFGTLGGRTASCSGTPPGNTDWGQEEDMDIEWAHAMAPSAKIFLVEACTNSLNDLLYAEAVAGIKVAAAGGGDISNSWLSGEFSGEVGTVDDFFYRYYWKNITYFAAAGDSGWGAKYPSSSPWVVSAGGTTINRDASGNFLSESCWSGSGGGVSLYELWQSPPSILNGMGPWTNFQYPFAVQGARQTPDMSFDSDPSTGVNVYDSYGGYGWFIVAGTSLASPALAGIVNASANKLGQAPPGGGSYFAQENNLLYSQLNSFTAYPKNFYDVKTGSNGPGHNAGTGYDQCTGIGSPRGKLGK